jgi:PAS domain S-box-containing protein
MNIDSFKNIFESSDRNMKEIINSIDQNFIFIDKNFKIKSFNDYSARNIFNLRTKEPIKENTDFFDYAAPSKIDEFKEKILPVFEGKKFKHIEKINSGKDARWFESTYAPVYGINNKIIGIVYNSYDITLQKRNEEALIEVSANVSLTARIAKIANFVWYEKGDFFYWSDDFFRFFGLEPYEIEITMESFNDFLFPENYDFIKDNFHRVRKEKIVSDFEFKFRKKNGEIGYARSVASPLFDSNGNIEKIIVLLQDITSIKINEDKLTEYSKILENENKAKDKYFSIIAHDLRSPFTGLIGLTEVLSTNLDYLSSEEIKEIATELHKSAKNIYNLLNSLLEWSRIQRGKIKYQKVEIPFLYLVEKVLDIFKNNIEIKNIKLIKTVNPDMIINSDSYVLELVLRNLISNAVKFVDYGGIIEISSELKDSLVFVSVKDNGIGIPEKEVENIFKLDKIFTRKGTTGETGNGLGLLLCKEHLERIGGNIYFSSIEDKGSVFTFFVPKD